ncbi:MAG: hypothetical protein SNF33_02055 [Candidatus Algichlamydia australiensis]|nr:hypothetical protein [Chlamydiales bacterium]
MTTSTTIDNLPKTEHLRYAEEQIEFDPKFIQEAFIGGLAAAPEITNGYKPLLDLLLGFHKTNAPFAHFAEPPVLRKRKKHRRKLFSRRGILADIDSEDLPEDMEGFELSDGSTRDRELLEAFLKDLRYIDALVLEAYGKIDRLQMG